MTTELRRDVAFVANVLANVVSLLAATYDEGNRLLHRARQALRSAERLRDEVDSELDELLDERAGAS